MIHPEMKMLSVIYVLDVYAVIIQETRTKKFSVEIFWVTAIHGRNKRRFICIIVHREYIECFFLYFRDDVNSDDKQFQYSFNIVRFLAYRDAIVDFSQVNFANGLYILSDDTVLEFHPRLHYVGTRSLFYVPVTTATITSCRVYEMRSDRTVSGRVKRVCVSRGR